MEQRFPSYVFLQARRFTVGTSAARSALSEFCWRHFIAWKNPSGS
jgi:hypothetical protein